MTCDFHLEHFHVLYVILNEKKEEKPVLSAFVSIHSNTF
jgi:hypothetical protein